MMNLLNLEVLENAQGGHGDLLFDMPNLTGQRKFDTYYFALAIEPKNELPDIKDAVKKLIESWIQNLDELKNGKTVYLPIDFSDQYTGCLQVEKDNDLKLTYGYSMREGWGVDPLSPTDYFESIHDFKSEDEKSIRVDQWEFRNCLIELIDKLKND